MGLCRCGAAPCRLDVSTYKSKWRHCLCKEKLKERSLIVGGPLHATCAAYIDLLAQFEQQSYPVQAVAFWLIEYVYYKVPAPTHNSTHMQKRCIVYN